METLEALEAVEMLEPGRDVVLGSGTAREAHR
jgi:hypothetical protein